MSAFLNFYSEKKGEIKRFLDLYYFQNNDDLNDSLFWKKEFQNPVEMIDIMTCFIDNNSKFNINLWISLDNDVYICISDSNINQIIKYIYERYPY